MFRRSGFLLLPLLAAAQQPFSTTAAGFAPGGEVIMDLHAGDYTVKAGASDKVVVRYTTRYQQDLRRVRAEISASGRKATIYINPPDNSNFRATIEIPEQSDVVIHLTAGDLRVESLTGNKEISTRAGDVDVYLPRPEDYGEVRASVTAGDISAPAFHGSSSGLFRSFHYSGAGKYKLSVRVLAGDIRLH